MRKERVRNNNLCYGFVKKFSIDINEFLKKRISRQKRAEWFV